MASGTTQPTQTVTQCEAVTPPLAHTATKLPSSDDLTFKLVLGNLCLLTNGKKGSAGRLAGGEHLESEQQR